MPPKPGLPQHAAFSAGERFSQVKCAANSKNRRCRKWKSVGLPSTAGVARAFQVPCSGGCTVFCGHVKCDGATMRIFLFLYPQVLPPGSSEFLDLV